MRVFINASGVDCGSEYFMMRIWSCVDFCYVMVLDWSDGGVFAIGHAAPCFAGGCHFGGA